MEKFPKMKTNEQVISELKELITDKVKGLDDKLTNLKVTIDEVIKNTNTNTTNISKLEKNFKEHKGECETDRLSLRKMIRVNDQKKLANDIVLKGFPHDKFDVNEVKQNIATICQIEHGYNDYYKFSRNIGKDKETNEPIIIYLMTLSFVSNLDKKKVFKVLKEKGHWLLADLLSNCEGDEKEAVIWVENSMTVENLKIRKRLLELKREAKIVGFMMRSGLFIVKVNQKDGTVATFNIFELSRLNEIFPEKKKRTRTSDTLSPSNPGTSQNAKQFKSVSGNK